MVLAAITIALYSSAIGHPFLVLDDREYVTANTHIRGLGWENLKWAFTSMEAANWHPLTWISHGLDYKLFALNAWGHHADNVLIHALNAILLFLFLNWVTRRTGPSLLAAALFALHPINVESVAWVAERKNVLSTFFFLLVVIAYSWYARNPGWRRYLSVAVLFAATLMAKPMGVTLPFVLLLLDYWPLERMRFKAGNGGLPNISGARPTRLVTLVLEKLPLLLLSAASSWLTLKAQHAVVQGLEEFSPTNRIENALISYGLYLWKMVWPTNLALYPHPLGSLPKWQWMLSAFVLAGVTVIVIFFAKKSYLPVGWFWFLGTMVPVLGLVQVGEYAMADRYAYIPLIGMFIMITWGLADLADAKGLRQAWRAVPALCVLAALSIVTVHQIGYWGSDYELYSHTLDMQESSFAHNAIAMSLMNAASEMNQQDLQEFASEPARIDAARRHFERALEMRQAQEPDSSLQDKARTLTNLGNLDRMQNRLQEARQHEEAALGIYRQLAQQNPDLYLQYVAVGANNLASINRLQNHSGEARQGYQESLNINRQLAQQNPAKYLPNVAMVLNEYARLEATQGRLDSAREKYEEALGIDRQFAQQSPDVYLPQLAMTLTNFALLDAFQQRFDEARQRYEEALKIDRGLAQADAAVYLPDVAMTLGNLGRVERLEGKLQSSHAHYEEAYNLLQLLVQGNDAYAGELAQVEDSLKELSKISSSQRF